MRIILFSFVVGHVVAGLLPRLGSVPLVFLVVLAASPLVVARRGRAVFMLAMGYANFTLAASDHVKNLIPADLAQSELSVVGVVSSIPVETKGIQRFVVNVDEVGHNGRVVSSGGKLRMSSYNRHMTIRSGETWRFRARLKPPRLSFNRYGFDYEGWLFSNRYIGRGYVVDSGHRISEAGRFSIHRLRQELYRQLRQSIGAKPHFGITTALVLGERSAISWSQRTVLAKTGTAHLVAISGLHIGLAAGLGALIARLAAGLLLLFGASVRIRIWVLAGALAAAFMFSCLAGLSLPTQRALLMISMATLLMLSAKRTSTILILLYAAAAILVNDPVSAVSASFWLSFCAVASIFLISALRKKTIATAARPAAAGWYLKYSRRAAAAIRIHLLLGLLLFPVLAIVFGNVPLVSPLANAIAIPAVSVSSAPLAMLGVWLWLAGADGLAAMLFEYSQTSVGLWWPVVAALSVVEPVPLSSSSGSLHLLSGLLLGSVLVMDCWCWRFRLIGLILLVCLFVPAPHPGDNKLRIIMMDVGQGLAVLVSSGDRQVLYDSGGGSVDGFNHGRAVIIPTLRGEGMGSPDLFVVSHENRDHSGGAMAVLGELGAGSFISLAPAKYRTGQRCRSGQRWFYGSLSVEVLHAGGPGGAADNNSSCVVRITNGQFSVLLPGDIEKPAELRLLNKRISSDVLIVPHHGSKSSSTKAFIETVSPRYALISAGYLNRFGHPHESVVSRFCAHGVTVLDTSRYGAITLVLDNKPPRIQLSRLENGRLWHRLVEP